MSDPDQTRPTEDVSPAQRQRVLAFRSLKPGTLFARRYRVKRSLGHGGAGEVYHATDEVAGLDVAIKVLYPHSGKLTLERLRRELRLVRGLRHPGILRVIDIGQCDGMLFLVSELLEGCTLREHLARLGRPMTPDEALPVIKGLLVALGAAHAAGIVHRDIKPGNIFLCRGGEDGVPRVVLLDFGLVREVEDAGLTTTGHFLGTPQYAAPEQIRGAPVTAATDLYAAGVTILEMLSGSPPFEAASNFEILRLHLEQTPPALRLRGRSGARLAALTGWLLEKEPGLRPPSAGAALNALERGVGWRGTAARFLRSTLRRRWTRVTAACAALAAALAAALWALAPVRVDLRGDAHGVRWQTRLGIGVDSETFIDRAAGAVLDPALGLGPWRQTWALTRDDSGHLGLMRSRRVGAPFERLETVLDTWNLGAEVYPGHVGDWAIWDLLALPDPAATDTAKLAAVVRQVTTFPSRIDLIGSRGAVLGSYVHPGSIRQVVPWRPPGQSVDWLFVLATNNLLGPRQAVFGFPARADQCGEAPPFTSLLESKRRGGGWYALLPINKRIRGTEISIENGTLRVCLFGEGELHFDLLTGALLGDSRPAHRAASPTIAPERARLRNAAPDNAAPGSSRENISALADSAPGSAAADAAAPTDPAPAASAVGSSAAAIVMQRELGWERLAQAQALAGAGEPLRGAEQLEGWLARQASRSIEAAALWYRAALMRLRGSERDSAQLEHALADIRRALRLDAWPWRYRLLEGELLLRLGRRAPLEELLAEEVQRQRGQMLGYEWLLLEGLAHPGGARSSAWDGWTVSEKREGWKVLENLLLAHRAGDCAGAPARAAELNPVTRWDVHDYWIGRCLLDADPPEPERALAELSGSRNNPTSGFFPPRSLARLRAQALIDPSSIGEEERRAARLALDEQERRARFELHALYTLRYAREDAKQVLSTGSEPH